MFLAMASTMTQNQTQQAPLDPRAPPQNGTYVSSMEARQISVQSFGLTDRGRKRETNEDQFVTASLMRALWVQQSSVPQAPVRYGDHRGHVFIVADGMGGAACGENASAIAVGAVEDFLLNALRWLLTLEGAAEASVLHDFKAALRTADACVYAAATNTPALRGMGTTLTMAYSLDADLFVAHVGDSRGYLLRGGVLHRLTRDDTLVQQMVEKGLLTQEGAAQHDLRHIITNVVGGPTPGVKATVHRMRLERGDVLLLCTDGLTGMLADDRIAAVLQSSVGPQEACGELVRLANEQGGADNVTVVVARYV
jgi:PPM family protein phosphatase